MKNTMNSLAKKALVALLAATFVVSGVEAKDPKPQDDVVYEGWFKELVEAKSGANEALMQFRWRELKGIFPKVETTKEEEKRHVPRAKGDYTKDEQKSFDYLLQVRIEEGLIAPLRVQLGAGKTDNENLAFLKEQASDWDSVIVELRDFLEKVTDKGAKKSFNALLDGKESFINGDITGILKYFDCDGILPVKMRPAKKK